MIKIILNAARYYISMLYHRDISMIKLFSILEHLIIFKHLYDQDNF